ncbi:hypothetical protein DPMN_170939 [Dreissena polymorpha]|uniref:Transglutaminase C-terminal domain-containing protein n=1 Tax=Dreissena polymorpha TaxID=45954 RepID=A0A9D4E075_DREPO|nr:hypothetical protein DPMN_170939 [Dreissena polymorpha]
MTVQGPDNVMVGFDVSISVTCKNKSEEKRHLEGNVFVEVITYTGKTLATCKVEEAKLTLGGFERT